MNLFLFHRDLRLIDNTALIRQLKKYKQITPIFIFNTVQIDPKKNSYFCHNSVQFMTECLKQLQSDIQKLNGKLYYFYGHNLQVLKAINQSQNISSIYYNYDYTPFAKSRDQQIENWAKTQKIDVVTTEDYVLYNILEGQTKNPKTDSPHLVFTPYKNHCMAKMKVRAPDTFEFNPHHFTKNPALQNLKCYFQSEQMRHLFEPNQNIKVRGGRKRGLQILNNIKKFKSYNEQRNLLAVQTTNLSAYLHFTPISIRQVFLKVVAQLGMQNNIINQIHWRDFYVNITHYFPRILAKQNNSFQPKFDNIKWRYNQEQLNAWKEGRTGFPIVDAGMRELNTTGFMHNRTRMIVASFLAKDLFLDWHEGQKYFASKLVDVSPMQNSGGWQWTIGNGADAQGYYRIFNPWLQQKNYDPECTYIKRWIPQLIDVPVDDLHKWDKVSKIYRKKGINYPNPMLDHQMARKQTVQIFDKFLKKQHWKQKQV